MQRPRYLQDQGYSAGPVLVSYLGVVYQRGFFDDRVFQYGQGCQQCRFQDRSGLKRLSLQPPRSPVVIKWASGECFAYSVMRMTVMMLQDSSCSWWS